MAKIRTLAFNDIHKVKKMISMLPAAESENFYFGLGEAYIPFPFNFLHGLLPLKFKFCNESYVATDKGEINGMISLNAIPGNHCSWRINKLILKENAYDTGRQLVDYVVARYGAAGANTFIVRVDENQEEIIELFSKGCGFRVCSSEQLWKMKEINLRQPFFDKGFFRPFKKADAKEVTALYNELILPYFRYSLEKKKQEFYDILFSGLSKNTYFKYVLEDNSKNPIKGYFSIQTDDNKNFILDINLIQPYIEHYPDIINFCIGQILMRKKDFNLYILNKKYQSTSSKTEEYLNTNGFECINHRIVMVKDFYKRIQEPERFAKPAIVFNDIGRKPAFKI